MKVSSTRSLSLWAVALLVLSGSAWAQNATIQGRLTDATTSQPLVAASVIIVGTNIGSASDGDGNYAISNVPPGNYTLRATYLGYALQEQQVNAPAGASVTVDFSLTQTVLQYGEVIVEVNRARERETPVAFTDVGKEQLDQRMHGQDAPLLLRGTPGLYSYGADGSGSTGEGQLHIRGFNQNYVQVLINGVPTNDPESNAVYWSNWGSVSANAASIQVQRGAGSSLYGAGSFGGSFNIVTADALPRPFYGINATLGDPLNTFFGIDLNTGLTSDNMAFTLRLDRRINEGARRGARYTGLNYYFSGSWYFTDNQSLKVVLHGAPQQHGYSFSNDISYFKRYGYDANQAPWLPRSIVEQFPANATSGAANYGLLDDSRELVDDEKVALAHNFFHKPQFEVHYSNDLTSTSAVRATFFYSIGRGGGSSFNSGGFVYGRNSTTNAITDRLGPNGQVDNLTTALNTYLDEAGSPAYQRTSFSLHQQFGVIGSYSTQASDDMRLTVGGEFRSWTADHPGHFTNLYGQTSANWTYEYRRLSDNSVGTFSRRVVQNDLRSPGNVDVGSVFGWEQADEPTYQSQYRNYRGETPQFTLYTQANYRVTKDFNILGSIQYVWYKYKLIENMPSESGVGRELAPATATGLGLLSSANEGKRGDKFYMVNNTGTTWYEFVLVNAERSRGFLQPKVGANYNITENINVFGNFSHVERFTDLSVYYNSGNLNPDADDEKSNQFEFGFGWTSSDIQAKVNLYTMAWDNKSARIQDISKAGLPGYDRNGFRTELIGSSRHQGIEVEFNARLDNYIPIKGVTVRGSVTMMDNKWTKVLDQVKIDKNTGARRPFNTSAYNAQGVRYTQYFDELENTPVASQAQQMASLGISYNFAEYFVSLDANHFDRFYALDGATYMAVNGSFNAAGTVFNPVWRSELPSTVVYDLQAGARYKVAGISGTVTGQIINLFDNDYLASADRFGVIPGGLRTLRLSISAGL